MALQTEIHDALVRVRDALNRAVIISKNLVPYSESGYRLRPELKHLEISNDDMETLQRLVERLGREVLDVRVIDPKDWVPFWDYAYREWSGPINFLQRAITSLGNTERFLRLLDEKLRHRRTV